MSRAVMVTL